MSEFVSLKANPVSDFFALTKPRITFLCLLMTLGGMALVPGPLNFKLVFWTLLGTAFSVGSANALNMVWERDSDKLMKRTRNRPLPSGRMHSQHALIFGVVLGILSVVILSIYVNVLTAGLGLFALLGYVLIYTPLKRRSPHALIVGAVPGAMPPLMGWTAATGHISLPGVFLFLVLFIWQIPHFIAISLYYKADYAKAGIQTLSVVRGDKNAKIQALAYSFSLIPLSLMFVPLGVAGYLYAAVALILGTWFVSLSAQGLSPNAGSVWARKFFLASLIYLPALTFGLLLDSVLK